MSTSLPHAFPNLNDAALADVRWSGLERDHLYTDPPTHFLSVWAKECQGRADLGFSLGSHVGRALTSAHPGAGQDVSAAMKLAYFVCPLEVRW
jgi:hypothetical protein